MLKLQNPSNACVRIETEDCIMLCDPWFTRGIFEGGWDNYPPVTEPEKIIKDVTHLFISHIHEDHWDLNVIRSLSRNVDIFIPDLYPNHLIKNQLQKEGFRRITMLMTGKPAVVSNGVTLEVIPPMNSYAQEFPLYGANEEQRPVFSIDAGCIIDDGEVKIVLLSDNSPYNPSSAGRSLKRMKNADLLAFPYNGAAADFPLCYEFPIQEIVKIANERERRREKATVKFLELVTPKLAMPYSSDFAVLGPMAEKHCCFENEFWFNKKSVATHYKEQHEISTTYLLEGDVICIDKNGYRYESKRTDFPQLREFLFDNYHESPLTKTLYSSPSSYDVIENKSRDAAVNMFLLMEKYGFETDWLLTIELSDLDERRIIIDFRDKCVKETKDIDRKMLTCIVDSGYFEALLDRRSHWNNAHSSFQLRWKREPNEYDIFLYGALNFFHLPIKKDAT